LSAIVFAKPGGVPKIPAGVEQSQRDRPVAFDLGDEFRHLISICHVARRRDD
jgi:hypothetical protein